MAAYLTDFSRNILWVCFEDATRIMFSGAAFIQIPLISDTNAVPRQDMIHPPGSDPANSERIFAMKAKVIATAVGLTAVFIAPAFAGDRYVTETRDFFGFPQPAQVKHYYCNSGPDCHYSGVPLTNHNDPVHPDIGAQTDN
jgi:hypothetical protein